MVDIGSYSFELMPTELPVHRVSAVFSWGNRKHVHADVSLLLGLRSFLNGYCS